jgi:SAM-dependent methyltransferase
MPLVNRYREQLRHVATNTVGTFWLEDAYVCPLDSARLVVLGQSLRCQKCSREYPVRDHIAELDVVQSPERTVFDHKHANCKALGADDRAVSSLLAERFLRQTGSLQKKRILDMACGDGALTYGLITRPEVDRCDIFAFDHSRESVRVLRDSIIGETYSNTVYLSIQDVNSIAYRESFFDVILGNAILHHFLDVERVLADTFRLLRPAGVALFAEPFANGYVLAMLLLRIAQKRLNAPTKGLGLYDFITQNIALRVNHASDRATLASLTDKHLFFVEDLVRFANRIGFRVSFEQYESDAYYTSFMDDILKTYQLEGTTIAEEARALYGDILEYLERSFAKILSHFKLIVLQKP